MSKKAQIGFETLVKWLIVIAIGVVLLVILGATTDFGRSVMEKIENVFPFI